MFRFLLPCANGNSSIAFQVDSSSLFYQTIAYCLLIKGLNRWNVIWLHYNKHKKGHVLCMQYSNYFNFFLFILPICAHFSKVALFRISIPSILRCVSILFSHIHFISNWQTGSTQYQFLFCTAFDFVHSLIQHTSRYVYVLAVKIWLWHNVAKLIDLYFLNNSSLREKGSKEKEVGEFFSLYVLRDMYVTNTPHQRHTLSDFWFT